MYFWRSRASQLPSNKKQNLVKSHVALIVQCGPQQQQKYVEYNTILWYANGVHLSAIWENTAHFRRTPWSLNMCCIFTYRTKNEQHLYFLTRSTHTWHIQPCIVLNLQLECDMGWYRYTSHSENHSTECESMLIIHRMQILFRGNIQIVAYQKHREGLKANMAPWPIKVCSDAEENAPNYGQRQWWD